MKSSAKGFHEDDGTKHETEASDVQPVDIQVLKYILESMGVQQYEPRVVNQLQEFVHRYVTEILIDAQEYSMYAEKKDIDADDIRLAITSRLNHHYAQVPSRELLMELADKRNSIPLPSISNEYGVRLPPMQYQLISHEGERPEAGDKREHEESDGVMDDTPGGSPINRLPRGEGSRNKRISQNPIAIRINPR